MENTKLSKSAPVLPYDITHGETFLIYDAMAYVCDPVLCNKEMVHMESGNIIKYYEWMQKEPLKIGGE